MKKKRSALPADTVRSARAQDPRRRGRTQSIRPRVKKTKTAPSTKVRASKNNSLFTEWIDQLSILSKDQIKQFLLEVGLSSDAFAPYIFPTHERDALATLLKSAVPETLHSNLSRLLDELEAVITYYCLMRYLIGRVKHGKTIPKQDLITRIRDSANALAKALVDLVSDVELHSLLNSCIEQRRHDALTQLATELPGMYSPNNQTTALLPTASICYGVALLADVAGTLKDFRGGRHKSPEMEFLLRPTVACLWKYLPILFGKDTYDRETIFQALRLMLDYGMPTAQKLGSFDFPQIYKHVHSNSLIRVSAQVNAKRVQNKLAQAKAQLVHRILKKIEDGTLT